MTKILAFQQPKPGGETCTHLHKSQMDLSGFENDYNAQEEGDFWGGLESEDDLNQGGACGDVSGKEGDYGLLKPPHHQV